MLPSHARQAQPSQPRYHACLPPRVALHAHTSKWRCTPAVGQVVTKTHTRANSVILFLAELPILPSTSASKRPAPRLVPRPRSPSWPISALPFSVLIIASPRRLCIGQGGEFGRGGEHDLSGESSLQGAVITLINVIGRTSGEEAR